MASDEGLRFSLKPSSSNTAVGWGRLYFCRLSYSPVPGVLKSGMPALTDIPAPAMADDALALADLMYSRDARIARRTE